MSPYIPLNPPLSPSVYYPIQSRKKSVESLGFFPTTPASTRSREWRCWRFFDFFCNIFIQCCADITNDVNGWEYGFYMD